PDGYAKVLDFGIAKLTEQGSVPGQQTIETTALLQTRPGLVLGTARYMSPEQARGQKVDARSDIWSLGVVLYEMVGGSPPFPGETPSDCIASILTKEPPPLSEMLPDVPMKLEAVLQKALRKDRDERYPRPGKCLQTLALSKANWNWQAPRVPDLSSVKSNVPSAACYSSWRRQSLPARRSPTFFSSSFRGYQRIKNPSPCCHLRT